MPLPDYSVRISTRAKRLQLRIKPPGMVEVVLPKGMSARQVPGFVAQHTDWIAKHLGRLKHRPRTIVEPALPESVFLAATNETWQVRTSQKNMCDHNVIEHSANRMLLVSATDKQSQIQGLQRWLSNHAKRVLPPWLQEVSHETNLPFNRVTIRAQKTRWGSCSSQKNISLNRALLFLSPEAVHYLFIHELCHTVHLNHSPRYWALVASIEPNYRQYDAELNSAARNLPHWAAVRC